MGRRRPRDRRVPVRVAARRADQIETADKPALSYEAATGRVVGGPLDLLLDPPRLELWRSPVDNEARGRGAEVADAWRKLNLHLLRRRTESVEQNDDGSIVIQEVIGPAAFPPRCRVTYRYTPTTAACGSRLAARSRDSGRRCCRGSRWR